MSDSVRLHRWQPTRLPSPWDSPGKNTGVGCHFLLQCVKVKSESEVARSCPTLSDPMDCSPPSSSILGTFQARVLDWGATAFSQAVAQVKCHQVESMGKASQEEATCRVRPQTGLPGGLTSSFSAGESPGNLLHLELRERNRDNKNSSSLLCSRPPLSNRIFCDAISSLYL